jgi:multiple sugar transport system permease protein
MVMLVAFVIIPLGYSLYLSLYRTTLSGELAYVGLANFRATLSTSVFWTSLWRTLIVGALSLPFTLVLAAVLSLLLDAAEDRFAAFCRLMYFLPYAVPTAVATLLWGYMYAPGFGPLAGAAHAIGLGADALFTTHGIYLAIANILVWEYLGYNIVILHTALRGVPDEVIEAARLDGAREWQIAVYIKLRLIERTIGLLGLFGVIGMVALFNEAFLLQPLAPDVISTTYTPNLYAYSAAFVTGQIGIAAAVSFVIGFAAFALASALLLVRRARTRGTMTAT